jgi:N6-L-threonylcarbamoyladenine synthase
MTVLGETIDDAAGEAFDKAAKIMNLPYPGGPLIDKYAALGNPLAFKFTKPQLPELNFSFSGLKTGFMNFINKETSKNPNFVTENLNDICASIQHTIIEILMDKLKKAALQTGIQHIAIAGGVSANSGLRKELLKNEELLGWKVFIPDFQYCTDNAAMIAMTGYLKYLKKDFTTQATTPSARYSIA